MNTPGGKKTLCPEKFDADLAVKDTTAPGNSIFISVVDGAQVDGCYLISPSKLSFPREDTLLAKFLCMLRTTCGVPLQQRSVRYFFLVLSTQIAD